MMRALSASAFRIQASARAGILICSTISMTCSLAPPCSGPLRAPMAAVTAEYRSESVAAVTRAAKVEAFNPWSACRIRPMSKVLAASSAGLLAGQHVEEVRRPGSPGLGATGGLPRRMRSHAATSVGICAVRRDAFRSVASRELSAASGSKADSADTPVRSTSMGVVFLGSVRSRAISLGGSLRLAVADSALRCASSSFLVGSAPCQSR